MRICQFGTLLIYVIGMENRLPNGLFLKNVLIIINNNTEYQFYREMFNNSSVRSLFLVLPNGIVINNSPVERYYIHLKLNEENEIIIIRLIRCIQNRH